MLIKSSGPIDPGFFILTLGLSCHYVLVTDEGLILFDPGLSIHTAGLLRRMKSLSLPPENIRGVFLSHGHAERIGGLAYLRKFAPDLVVYGSPKLRSKLDDDLLVRSLYEEDLRISQLCGIKESALDFEEFNALTKVDRSAADSDVFRFKNEIIVRTVSSPGHTPESNAYYVQPHNYFVCDETFGYYQGRNLASPGGDDDLSLASASVVRIQDLEVFALCLPQSGALTGNLVRKHLNDLVQNTKDLQSETKLALDKGVSRTDIENSIRASFYKSGHSDPALQASIDRTFNNILKQLMG